VEALLADLEPLLYGINYVVFLRVYRTPFVADAPVEWYVGQALGPSAVIGGMSAVSGSEVVAEVQQSLRYVGDTGSGPKASALRSRRFKTLVPAVLSELERAISEASLVAQFWLRDGIKEGFGRGGKICSAAIADSFPKVRTPKDHSTAPVDCTTSSTSETSAAQTQNWSQSPRTSVKPTPPLTSSTHDIAHALPPRGAGT
jgi:hypothetical protein